MFANQLAFWKDLLSDSPSLGSNQVYTAVFGGVLFLSIVLVPAIGDAWINDRLRPRLALYVVVGVPTAWLLLFFAPAFLLAIFVIGITAGLVWFAKTVLLGSHGWLRRAAFAVIADLDRIPGPANFDDKLAHHRTAEASNRSLSRADHEVCPDTALSRPEGLHPPSGGSDVKPPRQLPGTCTVADYNDALVRLNATLL